MVIKYKKSWHIKLSNNPCDFMMDKGYIYLCDTKGFTIVNTKSFLCRYLYQRITIIH